MSGVIGGRVGACVFASSDRGAAPRASRLPNFSKKRSHWDKSRQVKYAASGAHLVHVPRLLNRPGFTRRNMKLVRKASSLGYGTRKRARRK